MCAADGHGLRGHLPVACRGSSWAPAAPAAPEVRRDLRNPGDFRHAHDSRQDCGVRLCHYRRGYRTQLEAMFATKVEHARASH